MKPQKAPRRSRQSPRLIEANRRNAQRSTGPRTPEGKAISRHNGLTHGLTARLELLPATDRAVIDAFTAPLIAALNPQTAEQAELARAIAEKHWHLSHARNVENGWISNAMDGALSEFECALAAAKAFAENCNAFARLSLYEQRIERVLSRLRENLTDAAREEKANSGFGFANNTFAAAGSAASAFPNKPHCE